MLEDSLLRSKIERFLEFRPAVRLIYYYIDKVDGIPRALLAMHRGNSRLTLPGGRFDTNDFKGYPDLWNALWHETLFREVKEEIGKSDMEIIRAMMEGRFRHLGMVLWRHPKTHTPCMDFVAAIEVPQPAITMLNTNWIPTNSELRDSMWVNTLEGEFLYDNVRLSMELLFDTLDPNRFFPLDDFSYDPDDFNESEAESIREELILLVNERL